MFAVDLGTDAELRPLETWHAEQFAEHLDRARDHIRPWVGPAFVTATVDGARGTLHRYASASADDGARLFGIWHAGRLRGGAMFTHFDSTSGSASWVAGSSRLPRDEAWRPGRAACCWAGRSTSGAYIEPSGGAGSTTNAAPGLRSD